MPGLSCVPTTLSEKAEWFLCPLLLLPAHLGNADMIQPGLIPLQPNLDFMDTFEPFQGEDGGRGETQLPMCPCPGHSTPGLLCHGETC